MITKKSVKSSIKISSIFKMVVVTDNYYTIWIRIGRVDVDPQMPSWIRYFRSFGYLRMQLQSKHSLKLAKILVNTQICMSCHFTLYTCIVFLEKNSEAFFDY